MACSIWQGGRALLVSIILPLVASGACYSLSLVDHSGRRCSRCPGRCPGCEVARAGEVCLQPGDCLALRCPPDEAPRTPGDTEAPEAAADPWPAPPPPVDHPSLADARGINGTGALSLYDCLRAFSERYVFHDQLESVQTQLRCHLQGMC